MADPHDDGAGRRREEGMPYRELTMIDVREVLRRWQARHSVRRIARESGIDRKTIARYITTAEEMALPLDRAVDDDEVHEVAQRNQARPLLEPSNEWQEITRHRARIETWLGR